MVTEISGLRNGKPWPAIGETIDLPDDEAKALLLAEQVVPGDKKDDYADTKLAERQAAEQRELDDIKAAEEQAKVDAKVAADKAAAAAKAQEVKAAADKKAAEKLAEVKGKK